MSGMGTYSIHGYKAFKKAQLLGGMAGNEDARHLWELSKRELIEVALRLTQGGRVDDVRGAVFEVQQEIKTLRDNKII